MDDDSLEHPRIIKPPLYSANQKRVMSNRIFSEIQGNRGRGERERIRESLRKRDRERERKRDRG